jgi:antitoxin component HigA of HigAB toxin-antitoxin module
MKKMSKKLIGGLTIVTLIATVGVVFAAAQTDGTAKNSILSMNFWRGPSVNETNKNCTVPKNFFGRASVNRYSPFLSDLTPAQQAELQTLITTLKNQNATPQEIQAAIQQKLDQYGIFDKQLGNEINRTEQRLQILNREKELRAEGYSWVNITDIIQKEFNITAFGCNGQEMGFPSDFPRGSPKGPHGLMPGKDSDN